MRTLRGPSRTWKSLHRTVSTSDVLVVARRHARVGLRVRPMRCPGSACDLAVRCRAGVEPRSQRTLRRPAGESKTGRSPRTPSVVLRACKPRPAGRTQSNLFNRSHARAPFRPLPIRAPRQAVLRTSFRLAPSLSNRSCDLPEVKTRDASNRRLPPNRTACTRTSCVPGSARHFRGGDAPRRVRLRAAFPGDRTFHDVQERFGGPLSSAILVVNASRLECTSVGVFFPRR